LSKNKKQTRVKGLSLQGFFEKVKTTNSFVLLKPKSIKTLYMKKILSLICCFTFAVTFAMAQYSVEVVITGAEDSLIYLSRYMGKEKSVVDSLRANKKGKVVFKSKNTTLEGGIYTISAGGENIEFLASGAKDFKIGISANTLNVGRSLKFINSKENDEFLKYIVQQNNFARQAQAIEQYYTQFQENQDSMLVMQRIFMVLQAEQSQFAESILKNNPGTLLASLILASKEPPFPAVDSLVGASSNPDSLYQTIVVAFAKKHFFDNINLNDERLIYSPLLDERLSLLFQQLLIYETPEEIIGVVDTLLFRAKPNKKVYRYLLTWLYDRYTESPVEGHHAVGKTLTDYMGDTTAVDWLSNYEKRVLRKNVKRYNLNPVGSIASDLMLQTPEGEPKSLHGVKAPYSILYFFNPGCGTCRMVTPVLNEIFQLFKDQGLQVFAVYPDRDSTEWTNYIEDKKLYDFINVWDPDQSANIYEKYSLHAIPQIYVLDENKKVMSKDIRVDDLHGILRVAFINVRK
jgi:thiol-disulfide isomerase/thioredoxin